MAPHPLQAYNLAGTFALSFCILMTAFKVMANRYSEVPVLSAWDRATNFEDPQVAGATIIAGSAVLVGLWYTFHSRSRTVLNPEEWQRYNLMEKKRISGNTALYRFRLPTTNSVLGLPIGQHISLKANIEGKDVQRSYTPTSSDDDKGFFDLIIKTYPQGNVSKFVGELKIGEQIQVKGPKGQMRYYPGMSREIGMVAGGTGFTPCLQIIRAVLKNPQDPTKISFIYANVTEDDILLREELEHLARDYPEKFTLQYFLNEPPKGWQGGVGFVTKDAIQEYLPAPAKDVKILLCGPPPFMTACKNHLDELGFEKPRTVSKMEDQVFCF